MLALGSFALGLGLVVTPVLAASTASGPSSGIAAAGLAVPVLVLAMTAVEAAASVRWPVAAIASAATVAAMAGTASATTFPTVPVNAADTSMSSGAWASMVGRSSYVASIRAVGAALSAHAEPDDRVLAVSVPAFALMADVRSGTPMLWLSFWGDGNRRGVEWLDQDGHHPDVVIVYGYDADALADDAELRTDPLAEYIRSNFTVVEISTAPAMTILRRNQD
jgi:hypothetical protein